MNRFRLMIGGLITALSLSAAPAFARPAYPAGSKGYTAGQKGYTRGYPAGGRVEVKPSGYYTGDRFNEALEERVLELVNATRRSYGLSALRLDARGTKAARALASEAGREGGFGSISFSLEQRLERQGLDTDYRPTGEARAIVQEKDVEVMARKIVKDWLKNPRQSKVLLSSELSYAGVAAFTDWDGEVTVVLDAFGAQHIPAPPTPAPCY